MPGARILMVNQIKTDLEQRRDGWKQSVNIRTITYDALKEQSKKDLINAEAAKQALNIKIRELKRNFSVKKWEDQYKLSVRLKNKAQRDLLYAKKNLIKYENTLKSFDTRVRLWTKNNPGKAMEYLGM